MGEHDFSDTVVREIGQTAMLFCENPDCRCFTGFSSADGRPRRIAEAAHVLASGRNGPRAESTTDFPSLNLSSSTNGIWLCANCHTQIDGDPSNFPATLLFSWKAQHQDLMRRIVGKDLEAALLNLQNDKRYHQEVRGLLSFLDGRRVLYEAMDAEFPPRVLDTLDIIRQRLVQTRASINPDADLFTVIHKLQDRIDNFLRNIGPQTDLRTLRCDSGDPIWRKFAQELYMFREDMIIVLRALAGSAGYKLIHF